MSVPLSTLNPQRSTLVEVEAPKTSQVSEPYSAFLLVDSEKTHSRTGSTP